jgi:hypothetical protein
MRPGIKWNYWDSFNQVSTYKRDLIFLIFCHVLQKTSDIIVYRSSNTTYASFIVDSFDNIFLLSFARNICQWDSKKDIYQKNIDSRWLSVYDWIFIVDDSSESWNINSMGKVSLFSPRKFYGSKDDKELIRLIEEIQLTLTNMKS